MKKIFTLLTTVLIVLSLSGQDTGFESKLKEHRSDVFTIWKTIIKNNPEFSNQNFSAREEKQSMDSMIYEEYREFDGGWRNSDKEEYFWNENGQEIMNISSGWMIEDMLWYEYIKTENSYDALGRISEILTQQRDGGDWFLLSKTAFSYDSKSITTAIVYVRDLESNTWIEYIKYEYAFSTDGKLETIIVYGNFDTPTVWQKAEKYEYSYNGDGDMETEVLLWWDEETNSWDNQEMYEYFYEGSGVLTMEQWSTWNSFESTWFTSSKVTFSHDDYNNISGYMEYWWESSINDWLIEEKCDYSYDNSFTFDQLLLPTSQTMYFFAFDILIFRHMLLTEMVYESDDTDWLEDNRTTYYYSGLNSSGVGENSQVNPSIYPNPATNYFTVDLGNSMETVSIELFDVQGRLVLSTKVASKDEVSVAQLDKGIYLYKLIGEQKTYSGSMVIK